MPREWLIQHRAGTLAEWAAAEASGPVLLAGERAYITDLNLDVVGDGVTKVASLGAVGSGTYAAAQVPEMDTAPGADNTAAILAARARAIARGVPLWIPRHPAGSAWKMLDVLPLWSGARILSPGGILDIQTDHSATGRGVYGTAVDDVRIEGLTLAQSNATARNGVYGMFSFLASGGVGCTNVTLRGVRVTGGESAVVYSERMTDFELVGVVGSGVWADGIHLARGTLRGTVSGARIRSVGDDAIALVSITSESGGAVTYPQMSDITITGCTVQDLPTLGSGLAIVGAKGVAVSGLTVRAAHANGVSIIDGAGIGAPAPADVTLTGVAVTGTTNGHGFLIGDATDVTLSGCSAKGCSDSGVALIGATRAYVTGSKFRGNTGYGVYETGGSGNALTACDIGGNTAGASQVATAVLTSCKTT